MLKQVQHDEKVSSKIGMSAIVQSPF